MSDLLPERRARDPWEKRPTETAKAFAAFAAYRDALTQRSMSAVATRMAQERLPHGTPEQVATRARTIRVRMARWASKHDWRDRVEAYDDHLDRRLRENRESLIVAAERREAAIANKGISMVAGRLFGDPEQNIQAIDPNRIPPEDLPNWLERMVRVRRLAHGQPTDYLRGNFTMSAHEVRRVFTDMFEILIRFVPDERRERAQAEIEAYLETSHNPW